MRRAHAMPFGAEMTDAGVRFALWAPSATTVDLVLDGTDRAMPQTGDGWRHLVVADAKAGGRYGFRIDGGLVVPDPASRFQPDDVNGLSEIVDPSAHVWTDDAWRGRPWEEVVLYETHVGTATAQGTYAALGDRLEALRDLGVTAVELLPIADFLGTRNWGYDGVLPYAPDAAYGRPEDLKRFVDRAHALGLMIFLDVVYNHFGPAGNYLHAYAKSFFTDRHQTPWGAGINFDGKDGGQVVRDFFVHDALYWLEEYHIDGLRFDAVHAILDDGPKHFVVELAERVRAALPERRHVHLVLENEANTARWLPRGADGRPTIHTAQWADDLHHCWHVLLTGEDSGYYGDFSQATVSQLGRCLAEGFAFQGEYFKTTKEERGEPSGHLPPAAFVTFLQNHDQVGNRAVGERLSHLAGPEKLALARAGLLLSPQIPMLWMGEEWSASTPFQFFVDFSDDEALSKAVREGRRKEFASFAAFAGEEVPDPTAPETFETSKLDWDEAAREPHKAVLDDTRRLLALRRDEVVPITKSRFQGAQAVHPTPESVDVTWRYDGGTLRFVANFGASPLSLTPGDLSRFWASPSVPEDGGTLPSWTGAFFAARS